MAVLQVNGNFYSSNIIIGLSQVYEGYIDIYFLTFIGPCIANIFAEYNQQDATFHNLSISVRRSACFRRFFRPSSGAQNYTYSVRYLSDQYCYLEFEVAQWLRCCVTNRKVAGSIPGGVIVIFH